MKAAMWMGAAMAALVSACSAGETTAPVETAAATPAAPTREEVLAHGKYLVEGAVMCGDCHTPRLADGMLDQTKMLHGAPILETPPPGMPYAKVSIPIAGVPDNYTEESLKVFLMTGTPADGSPPLPPMPGYRLNEADATAVAAYIASLPKAAAPPT